MKGLLCALALTLLIGFMRPAMAFGPLDDGLPPSGSLPSEPPVIDVPSTDPGSVGAAVATGRVNVRTGPGEDYKKLGSLKPGQTVAVWGIEGKWAEITWTGGPHAYVHMNYLEMEESAPPSEPPVIDVPSTDPGSVGAAVATGRVNVRTGPGKGYKKLGSLKPGQTVAVWSIEGKWAEITWTGDTRGYVHTNYLEIEEE